MYIIPIVGYIEFEDYKEYFNKNGTIHIKPGTVHIIVTAENTVLHEVSTPHLNDTTHIIYYYNEYNSKNLEFCYIKYSLVFL